MSVVALDLGHRKIGAAASDEIGLTVSPLGTIKRTALKADLCALKALFADRTVDRIVVGLPLNMDGTEGARARAARAFAAHLEEVWGIPVDLEDERLSSVEARERLRGRLRAARTKTAIDAVAAAVILETWLGSHRQTLSDSRMARDLK